MALTHINVQQQEFKLSLRGYSVKEVDEFLDDVVLALREREQETRDSEKRIAVLTEQLSANRDTEKAMHDSFQASQRAADATFLSSSHVLEKEALELELAGLRSAVTLLKADLQTVTAGALPAIEEIELKIEEAVKAHVGVVDDGNLELHHDALGWGLADITQELPIASSPDGVDVAEIVPHESQDSVAIGTSRENGPNHYRPFDTPQSDEATGDPEPELDNLAEQDGMFKPADSWPSLFLDEAPQDPFEDPSTEIFDDDGDDQDPTDVPR